VSLVFFVALAFVAFQAGRYLLARSWYTVPVLLFMVGILSGIGAILIVLRGIGRVFYCSGLGWC
jgi:hypothetical protein